MRTLFVSLFLLAGCSHARVVPLKYSKDIHLDHNQVMICAYDQSVGQIGCMTPEEYEIRRSMGEFN